MIPSIDSQASHSPVPRRSLAVANAIRACFHPSLRRVFCAPVLRDIGICMLAAMVSAVVGLSLVRHHLLFPASACSESVAAARTQLSLEQFREFAAGGKGLVLDARDDVAYAQGHVPGALSLPAYRFASGYAQLQPQLEADRSRPIAVYCSHAHCSASGEVQERLAGLGYGNVAVFPGGWEAWRQARGPAEKSDRIEPPLAPWKQTL